MRRTKLLLLLTLFAVGMSAQQLQTPNLKFGKPTDEELSMKTYDHDTTAAAIVLCQLTDVRYDFMSNMNLTQLTEVKTRIKILKPDGKKYADISIPYYRSSTSAEAQEEIKGLKVVTYNMENGKLKKTSLPGKMIFDKDINENHHTVDFSAPDVKVGSVIEYTYTKWSNMWYSLDDYYAQARIPVAYCHYSADVPDIFNLSVQYTKVGDFTSNTSHGTIKLPGQNLANPNLATNIYEATGNFLPALKDNDYLFCPKDYSAHVTNELMSIQIPGEQIQNLSEKWEDVDKNMLNSTSFGARLNDHSGLKDEILGSDIPKISNFKQKVAELYQMMLKHVKWNGKYRLFPDEKNKPLKSGTGSNADLNMLFISMLNDLGITNHPVIMSSRSNGELSPLFANLEHLNTFIIAVSDNVNTYFIDSSVKDGYLNLLPPELYTDKARIIGKKFESQWVNLKEIANGQTTIFENIIVGSDGTAKANCTIRYVNNSSESRKSDYHEAKDSATWVGDIANDHGITIDSYSFKGPETFSPTADEKISYTKQLDATDSLIYIAPFTMRQIDSNPFTAVKRDLPLEFPYKQKTTYIVNIDIPQGYTPEELPSPYRATTLDKGMTAMVNFRYDQESRRIQVVMKYDVNKLLFHQSEYQNLKTMMDKLIEICNTTIAIKKM